MTSIIERLIEEIKEENKWLNTERTSLLQRERKALEENFNLKRKNYELQTTLLNTIGNLHVLLQTTWEQETRDALMELLFELSDDFERLTRRES